MESDQYITPDNFKKDGSFNDFKSEPHAFTARQNSSHTIADCQDNISENSQIVYAYSLDGKLKTEISQDGVCQPSVEKLQKSEEKLFREEKPFKCRVCGKGFSNVHVLKRHEFIHTGRKPYKCSKCEKSFNQPGHLKRHKMKHSGIRPFNCMLCGKMFSQAWNLKTHLKSHARGYFSTLTNASSTGTTGNANSRKCNQLHDLRTTLSENNNTGAQNSDLKSTVSEKISAIKKDLTELDPNTESMFLENPVFKNMCTNSSGGLFNCKYCRKSFSNFYVLKRHEIIHTGKKPYKCDKCGKGFTQLQHVKRHRLSIHNTSDPYKIDHHVLQFFQETMPLHTKKIKPFVCCVCDKGFVQPWSLNLHLKLHNLDNNSNQNESESSSLSVAADFNPESNKFQCSNIDYDKKSQKCMYCNKTFSNPYVLSRHEFLHTGCKPYKCNICDKGFKQPQHLKRHKSHLHNEPVSVVHRTDTLGVSPLVTHEKEISETSQNFTLPGNGSILTSSMYSFTGRDVNDSVPQGTQQSNFECTEKMERQVNSNERILKLTNVVSKNIKIKIQKEEDPTVLIDVGLLKCMYCSKEFSNQNNLNRHEFAHTGCKPYKCIKCGERFQHPEHLKKHLQFSHNKHTYIFKTNDSVKDNDYTKTSLKEETDSSDITKFQNNWLFKTSFTESNKTILKCMYCNKEFRNVYVLSRHEFQHTGLKLYKCEKCGKRFKQPQHLKRHTINLHIKPVKVNVNISQFSQETTQTSGVKPFLCNFCGKRFAQPWNLTLHMKSHTNHCEHPEYILSDYSNITEDSSKIIDKISQNVQTADPNELNKTSKSMHYNLRDRQSTSSSLANQNTANEIWDIALQGSPEDVNTVKHGSNDYNITQQCLSPRAYAGGVKHSYNTKAKLTDEASRGRFKCKLCSKNFCNPYVLSRHEFSHTGSKPYRCDICDKRFKQPQHLKRHRLNVHDSKKYNESEADKSMYSQETTEYKGVKPFECQICGKTFAQPWNLTLHMKSHTETENTILEDLLTPVLYKNCDLVSTTVLIESCSKDITPCQMEICNDNSSPVKISKPKGNFICKFCEKGFRNRYILSRHESAHAGYKPYKCEKCGLGFNQRYHLKRHQINVHSMKVSFTRTKQRNNKQKNEEKMEESTNLKEACDNVPRSMYQSKVATCMTIDTDTQAIPDNIAKNLKKLNVGNSNVRCLRSSLSPKDYGNSNDKLFKCKYCQKRFVNVHVLRRHEFAHSGKKPYKCGICEIGFNQPHHLKRHRMNIHNSQEQCTSRGQISENSNYLERKPFICEVCGKRFAQPWNLSAHAKSHWQEHPEKDDSNETEEFDSSVEAASMLEVVIGEMEPKISESGDTIVIFQTTAESSTQSQITNNHSGLEDDKLENFGHDKLKSNTQENIQTRSKNYENYHPNKKKLGNDKKSVTINMENFQSDLNSFDIIPCQMEICNDNSSPVKISKPKGNFICKFCEKGFRNRYILSRHESAHAGYKPYKCEKCGLGFNQRHHLKRHQINVHSMKVSFTRTKQRNNKQKNEEKIDESTNLKEACDNVPRSMYQSKVATCMTIDTDTQAIPDNIAKNLQKLNVGNLNVRCLRSRLSPKDYGNSNDKLFKCKYCQKRFVNVHVLRRHEFAHSGKKPYKCDICEIGFNQPHHLKRHRMNIHNSQEQRTSRGQISDNSNYLERKPFICEVCGKGFAQPWNLSAHAKSHWQEHPENDDSNETEEFESSVEAASMLEVIIGEMEPKILESGDTIVTFQTTAESSTQSQITNNHSGLEDDKLENFGHDKLKSNTQENIQTRSKSYENYHPNKKKLGNDQKSVTINMGNFQSDLNSFNNEPPENKNLQNDSVGKLLKCKQCEKQFTNPYVLRRHEFTHTGAKPFKCGQCGKGFTLSHHVSRHIDNVHSSKKSFQCSICGIKYSHAGKIERHMQTHESDKCKIFICQLCGQKFDQASKLLNHKNTHHSSETNILPVSEVSHSRNHQGFDQASKFSNHNETYHQSDTNLISSIQETPSLEDVSEIICQSPNFNSVSLMDDTNKKSTHIFQNQVLPQNDIQLLVPLGGNSSLHENNYSSNFQHPVYDHFQARMTYSFSSSNEKRDLYLNKVGDTNFQNTDVLDYSSAANLHTPQGINTQHSKVLTYSTATTEPRTTNYQLRNASSFSNVPTIQASQMFNSQNRNVLNYSTNLQEAHSQHINILNFSNSSNVQETGMVYYNSSQPSNVFNYPTSATFQENRATYSRNVLNCSSTVTIKNTKMPETYEANQQTSIVNYTTTTTTTVQENCVNSTKPDVLHESKIKVHDLNNSTHAVVLDFSNINSTKVSPSAKAITLSMTEKLKETNDHSKLIKQQLEDNLDPLEVKPYKCTICTKNFLTPVTLKAHLLLHEPRSKSFLCDACGKGFYSALNLDTHYRIHSGEKPYKCHFCDRRFPQSSGLEYHIRTHTGEKPYTCDVCEKSFACQHTLKTHYFTHTGERPYPCEFCGKRFAQRSILWRHKKSHVKDGQAPKLF